MLDKQILTIPFIQGVNTQDDPYTLPPGKFITLKNGLLDEKGNIHKRYGFEQLTQNISGGGTISSARELATRDNELLLLSENNWYSLNETEGYWDHLYGLGEDTGPLTASAISIHPSIPLHPSYPDIEAKGICVDNTNNQRLILWGTGSDSGNVNGWQLVDANNHILASENFTAGACTFRTAIRDDYFVIAYMYTTGSATSLYVKLINRTTFAVTNKTITVTSTDAQDTLSMVLTSSYIRVGVAVSSRTSIETYWAPWSTLTFTSDLSLSGYTSINAMKMCEFQSGYYVVFYVDGSALEGEPYTSSSISDGSTISVATVGSPNVYGIAACLAAGQSYPTLEVFFNKESGASGEISVQHLQIANNGSYVVGGVDTIARHSRLACFDALHFTDFPSQNYVTVYSDETTYTEQLGLLLVSSYGTVVAKITGEEVVEDKCFLSIEDSTLGNDKFYLLTTESLDSSTQTIRGITVDSTQVDKPLNVGSYLYLPGGYLSVYDGKYFTEHGFIRRPFAPVVAAGSGSFSYSYLLVFEWADASGRKYFSAPSVASSHLEPAAIDSGNTVSVTIPTCCMTNKTGVLLSLFRTANNGTTYYFVGSKPNNRSADSVSFTDNVDDDTLTANRRIYTDGGILENESLGAVRSLAVYKDRLVAMDAVRPGRIYHSQPGITFAPFEFCRDDLFIDVEQGDAEVTACREMDERLIIFKSDGILSVYGDGPDRLGANGLFSIPARVPATIGAVSDRGTYAFSSGIIFESSKGLFLLGRNLSLTAIGLEVGDDIAGVINISNLGTKHILAITNASKTFTYDLTNQQFGIFEPVVAVDACLLSNVWHWMDSSGLVRKQSTSSYLDGASRIDMVVETGWISFGDILRIKRIRRVQVLGQSGAAITIAFDVDTSYQSSLTQTVEFDASSAEAPWIRQVTVANQRTPSIKVKIYDSNYTPGVEGSLSLSGISLEVGIKNSGHKLASSKRG